MLTTTVETVSVIHAGMNISGKFVPVLDSPSAPLKNSDAPHVRAAKPSIITVMITRRLDEDFFAPTVPCGTS